MSSIRCPSCRHTIALKGVKPGKFQPKCPKCKQPFILVIPQDAGASPRATVVPENMPVTAEALDLETVPEPEPQVTTVAGVGADVSATLPPPGIDDDDQTIPPGADFEDDDITAPPPSPRGDSTRRTRVDSDETAVPVGLSEQMAAKLTQRSSASRSVSDGPSLQGKVGGYQILKKLGQGGMGAVYLAKQTSLDRNVALKVLAPRLASDPHFVSRFTREAFAAAQLTHHNVVQIHDIGVEHNQNNDTDVNYFSMEFVVGKTLARMVEETGRLDPEAAVGYVLQAARGLKFAHDHGLIHRDVKPDNILLNDQGVVKVADLGLVKRTGVAETLPQQDRSANASKAISADQTQTSIAMGTPAYMPPEQARDAAAVDARADVYSLGCTLYDLLTGRPPFVGRTAAELMTKHAKEQIVPPDRLDKHIPPELSKIVMTMLAKKPEDRYAGMGEVITALEGWLGVESSRAFSPQEDNVRVLEAAVDRFNRSKTAAVRRFLINVFFGVCAGTMLVCLLPMIGHPFWAVGMLGYVLATFVTYELVDGTLHHTFLIGKARQLLMDSSIYDWLTYALVIALTVVLLAVFHVLSAGVGIMVAAIGTAFGFYCVIDIPLAKERETSLKVAEKMLREMRLKGLDENALRQFVCKYAGRHWEEFYENMFGYEAKILARSAWGRGERAKNRPRHAAWREPVIGWMDRKLQMRQEERQQKMLARLESKALQADGMDPVEANRKARRNAERLVQKAAAVREAALDHATDLAVTRGRGSTTQVVEKNWMHDDSPPPRGHSRRGMHGNYFTRRYGSPADVLTGRLIRFVVATLLLVGFGTWWNENGGALVVKNTVEMSSSREEVTLTAARDTINRAIKTQRDYDINGPGHIPLRVEHVPDWLADPVGSWNGGLAGGLLLLSLFFSGRALGLSMFVAAALALVGHRLPIPILDGHATLSASAAVITWVLGIVFFRLTGE